MHVAVTTQSKPSQGNDITMHENTLNSTDAFSDDPSGNAQASAQVDDKSSDNASPSSSDGGVDQLSTPQLQTGSDFKFCGGSWTFGVIRSW